MKKYKLILLLVVFSSCQIDSPPEYYKLEKKELQDNGLQPYAGCFSQLALRVLLCVWFKKEKKGKEKMFLKNFILKCL